MFDESLENWLRVNYFDDCRHITLLSFNRRVPLRDQLHKFCCIKHFENYSIFFKINFNSVQPYLVIIGIWKFKMMSTIDNYLLKKNWLEQIWPRSYRLKSRGDPLPDHALHIFKFWLELVTILLRLARTNGISLGTD